MKRLMFGILSLSLVLAACGSAPTAAPTVPAATATPPPPTATPLPSAIATTAPTQTPSYPPEGYGPSNFPSAVDPLTGLPVIDPSLLDRRPMLIKVQNIPRSSRPQWGLSFADLVFEYYTEEGATRFAPIFLGSNADTVGPIRSGRFIDAQLVNGYKAMFAFGYAYVAEMQRFQHADFADRLVVPGSSTPFTRYEPNGNNYLVINTADLNAYTTRIGINGRQNLDGMSFNLTAPGGGVPVTQVYVRYSGVIYNRWDYDPSTNKYLRFSDTADDFNNTNEQYAQVSDRLTGQQLAFDNLVVLYVSHEQYSPGIYDIQLNGSGAGYAFRDGQAYQVNWQRNNGSVVSLTNPDGTPFPFKPGTTWFEVIGMNSTLKQTGESWRFTHVMP